MKKNIRQEKNRGNPVRGKAAHVSKNDAVSETHRTQEDGRVQENVHIQENDCAQERTYGYADSVLVTRAPRRHWFFFSLAIFVAILFILSFWFALDAKLLFGDDWLSQTYDNPDWRTNEGNLHTFGAWDLEAHIWKTEYIMEWFPHFQWNPYWYLGMPLFKYYQSGFYIANAAVTLITGLSVARAALLLVIFAHLLATLLTFLLCYKTSRKIWISALLSTFVLSNTFISLRSYGWEPITVTFLFLYPLGLLLFLKEPLRPLRFWLILVLGISFLTHPLLWFSLCMTMGIYLFSIAIKKTDEPKAAYQHYLWQYFILVFASILLGAVQFFPQISYSQVTSGAHMGVSYLPFYQVPPNIITIKDFLFDAGNLKGPGPIIMMAFFLFVFFFISDYWQRRARAFEQISQKKRTDLASVDVCINDVDNKNAGSKNINNKNASSKNVNSKNAGNKHTTNKNADSKNAGNKPAGNKRGIRDHELIFGLALVLLFMVLFYYLERYNIFPMNLFRSTQYHRIIPEFIIVATVLLAALSNIAREGVRKAVYYAMIIAFTLASIIVIYNIQGHWQTTQSINDSPEFIYEPIEGRFSMPYTDQSLSVRNSFTAQYQVYGYYEQGITNPYADELFSVSSGYHNLRLSMLYLEAANVGRLYVNTEEGSRDQIVSSRLNSSLPFVHYKGQRYGYFKIPLADASFAQAIDAREADAVTRLDLGCRVLYQEEYCGSEREEFVSTDPEEIAYLSAYVDLLEQPYNANASFLMINPDQYIITVHNATPETAVVVKMTYDKDFSASVNGRNVLIEPFGPWFMLIHPEQAGEYDIVLDYGLSLPVKAGAVVSLCSLLALIVIFLLRYVSRKRVMRKQVTRKRVVEEGVARESTLKTLQGDDE